MDAQQPKKEFGKRRPLPEAPEAPVKRSGHVALLVMGTIAAGAAAYALMPESRCDSLPPETATPGQPNTACTDNRSSGNWYSRSHYFSGGSSGHSSTAGSSDSQSGGVTRGGFGSFAHAFGFSGS